MKRERKTRVDKDGTLRRKKMVLIGLGAVASAILALLWIAAD
jgi:phosphoglycerate dehydrogenase-like enzyme